MTLAALGFAAMVGVIAVIDADNVISAVGRGFGTSAIVFVGGATIACGLACLVRGRIEVVALAAVAAAGLAIDLFVLAIWLDIDDDTYGKIAAVAFIWTFFGLIGLGLALAVQARETLARMLYLGGVGRDGRGRPHPDVVDRDDRRLRHADVGSRNRGPSRTRACCVRSRRHSCC